MAKSNEVLVRSGGRTVRGRLVLLCPDGADEAAANALEYTVIRNVELRLTNPPNAEIQRRNIVAANKDPLRIETFDPPERARRIAQEITTEAEKIRARRTG
jgi:hypothetical protein